MRGKNLNCEVKKSEFFTWQKQASLFSFSVENKGKHIWTLIISVREIIGSHVIFVIKWHKRVLVVKIIPVSSQRTESMNRTFLLPSSLSLFTLTIFNCFVNYYIYRYLKWTIFVRNILCSGLIFLLQFVSYSCLFLPYLEWWMVMILMSSCNSLCMYSAAGVTCKIKAEHLHGINTDVLYQTLPPLLILFICIWCWV